MKRVVSLIFLCLSLFLLFFTVGGIEAQKGTGGLGAGARPGPPRIPPTHPVLGEDDCQGVNRLQNPSFEGPHDYTAFVPGEHGFPNGHPDCPAGVCTTVLTAPNWLPWWRSNTQTTPDQPFERNPEFKAARTHDTGPNGAGDRVRSGQAAQQYFSFFGTHRAGVYQQVNAEPGETYRFCVWGYAWTQGDNDSDNVSGPDLGDLVMRVGIDPFGGTGWPIHDIAPDPENGIAESTASNIVWGNAQYGHDFWNGDDYTTWQLYAVEATALSNKITVVTYSDNHWATKTNDVYWDDATLVTAGITSLSVTPEDGIGFLAEVANPQLQSQAVMVELEGAGGADWTVAVNPGALNPSVSPATGESGESFDVMVNSSGRPLGVYTTTITIEAGGVRASNPHDMPVRLVVANQIRRYYFPIVGKIP